MMRWPARSRSLLFGLFLLLVLLVLNGSAVLIYDQVRGTIEQELGERLLGVASATAAGLDPAGLRALGTRPDSLATAPVRERLARIAFDTEIGDLYLFDRDRRHLVDAAGRLEPGFANPSLDLHHAAVTAALTGVPASSALYRVEGVYLKTAFAPVFDETGAVIAVVAAEGGATFFRGLWSLRRQVLFSGAAGMLVVVGLAALFYRMLRAQTLAERTVRETSALAAAGELAAGLAHEIRNPLAIISSRAERVGAKLAQGKPAEEIREWFETIPAEIARLDGILARYLSFARPAELQGEADVAATIDAVVALLGNEFTRRGIAVRREGVAAEGRVALAPAALHQMLVNLLLNARDAMPAGGAVTLATRRSGRELVIDVEDTGCGMTPEQQRRAFEPFYTTKPQGSGLGLAVVRSMLELYGARATVKSEPGHGARFTLWLPLAGA
jgi:signal transduction histidine kinase